MYIHNYLHESLTISGIVLFGMSMMMMMGNYVGGYLFDRWSPYRTSLIFITLSTVSVILMIFFHGWPAFAFLLLPIGLGDGVNLTLTNSYAATISNKSSRYIFNIMYIGLNLGVVIGTAMVGYLLKYGMTILMVVTSGFYVALLLMTILFFNVQDLRNVHPHHSASRNHYRSSFLLIAFICFLSFSIYLSYSLWESVISVHMSNLGISFQTYSSIWTVNGLIIVFGQAPINKLFSHIKLTHQIAVGLTIFCLSFLGLPFAWHFMTFVLIMVILTIGEIIGIPSVPAWLDDLAEPGKKGRYQAYFNVFMTLGRAVGPLFDGIIIEALSYSFLFNFSGLIVLVGILLVMALNHRLNATRVKGN